MFFLDRTGVAANKRAMGVDMKGTGTAVTEYSFQMDGRTFFWRVCEEWIPTNYGVEVSCGRDTEISIESTSGVSQSDTYALKGFMEASLGLKGIASLKSSLETSSSHQIVWSEQQKIAVKIPIVAPKCGAQLIQVYRKKRSFYIRTLKYRMWRDPVQIDLPTLHDFTNLYRARVTDDYDDLKCPCKSEISDGKRPGLPVSVAFGNLDLVLDTFHDAKGLAFRLGQAEYALPAKFLSVGRAGGALAGVPPLFLFLAGIEEVSDEIEADVTLLVPQPLSASEPVVEALQPASAGRLLAPSY